MARIDARVKANGAGKYAADIDLPGVLHASVVRSTLPRGRILAVGTELAMQVPGVAAVLTAKDVSPGLYGRGVADIPILARDEVRYVGERVAVVVAETELVAERAAALVEVEYEPLPGVHSLEEALAEDAPLVHERPWEFPRAYVQEGDGPNLQSIVSIGSREKAEAGLASAEYVIDAVYRTPGVHQGYLEPQATLAVVEASGILRLWTTNKGPYRLRAEMARLFEIDPELLEVEPILLGGDFGGKGSIGDAPICIEAARLTGRPVKLVLSYSEELTSTNPRHPSRTRVRIGCDAEGHLTGVLIDSVFNGGAYAGYKADTNAALKGMLEAPLYRVSGFFTEQRMMYTNTVPRGSMRAPGAPQLNFALESAMDELAAKSGIDPVELRRSNILLTGESPAAGHRWIEYRGLETLDAAVSTARTIPAPTGWLVGRGIAVFGRATHSNATTSLGVQEKPDGGLLVEVPIVEIGTGSHTVMRELIARRFGVRRDEIQVKQVSTRELPKDRGTSGSRVTSSMAVVVDMAAKAWADRSGDEPVVVALDKENDELEYGSFSIQVAYVAVDPETGELAVLGIDATVDVAEIINPKAHQMQIDGGTVMGFGFACLEDLDESSGQVFAANLGEFKIPSMRDTPELRTFLVRGGEGLGDANVKNVGELTTPVTAAAVANAIYDATGCRIRELPLTAERIHEALVAHRENGSALTVDSRSATVP